MSTDLRTLLLDTTPDDVVDLNVDRLVRRGARRRRTKRAGAAVAVLAFLTAGSLAVLSPATEGRLPIIGEDAPPAEVPTDAWRPLPEAAMGPRVGATIATDGDLVAFYGGESDEEVEVDGTTWTTLTLTDGAVYDAETDTWRGVPTSPLPARTGSNVELAGGQLLVVGGRELHPVAGAGGVPTGDQALTLGSSRFDLRTDTWHPMGAPDIAPRMPEVVTWDGTRLVLWGGLGEEDQDSMDGATWTEDGGWTTIPAAPLEARSGAAVAVVGDRLVVWGGTRAQDDTRPEDLFADGAVFDLSSGQWTALPRSPLSPRWIGHDGWPHRENARVDGDRVLIVGGATTGMGQERDGAWLDLTDLSWTDIAPAPDDARFVTARHGGVIAVDDETDEDQPYVTLWRYDEQGDRWEQTATRLRSDLEVHRVDPERIVVSSGGDEAQSQDSPRIGIWDAGSPSIVHTHPPLSGRMWPAIASLPDGVLVWGGLEIAAEDGGGRTVGDGARLDR